jgi:hypothetical protein
MSKKTKSPYADRDIMSDELMDHYHNHVWSMTEFGLHSKADIAAELAWRDLQIEKLKAQLKEKRVVDDPIDYEGLKNDIDNCMGRYL